MNAQALQSYVDAVSARGAALQNCFGFVDGTVRPIARPGEHQRLVYNGHKRDAKISVAGITEWSYCKYVRTHR